MRHRFMKVLLGAAVFALLAGQRRLPRARTTRRPRTTSDSSIPAPAFSPPTALSSSKGFKYGLKYATKGTGKVNGKTLNITYQDDQGRSRDRRHRGEGPRSARASRSSSAPARRASRSSSRRSRRRTRCSTSPGPRPRTRSPASTSTRSAPGRQTIPGRARREVVPREDDGQEGRRLRPGQRLRARQLRRRQGRSCGGPQGAPRSSVPLTASDFTPFAQQAKHANPDLIFVAWAGTTAGAMWQALDQQNVFAGTTGRDRPRRAGNVGALGRPGDEDPRSCRTTSTPLRRTRSTTGSCSRCASATRCRTCSRRTASSLGADARARVAEGRLQRRQDDLRARGLEVPRARRACRRSGRRITRCCSRCSRCSS